MSKLAALTFIEGVQLAGFGLSALGALQQGQQANLQAEIFRREAARREQESAVEAGEFGRSSSRLLARQRALRGASGVQAGTGTALELESDTAAEAEFQRLKILSGGDADVSRLLSQSILHGRQARLAPFRAGSILLRGAGEVFGKRGKRK